MTGVTLVAVRRPARTVKRTLGSIVLACESLVVFLAALVFFGLKNLPVSIALGGGGTVVFLMFVTIPLLRYRWGFWIGWVLQVIIIASGFFNPIMFVIGCLFTTLWAYSMVAGLKIDRQKQEQEENM
jgi:hypothetical protein